MPRIATTPDFTVDAAPPCNAPPGPETSAAEPPTKTEGSASISGWRRLLPHDPKRRLRTEQTALACLFSLGGCLLLSYGVAIGAVAFQAALQWSLLVTLGGLAFLVTMARGWSERCTDPSLTVAQMTFAISSCALAYGIAGPLRGAIFPLLMVAMMFGMFALPIRKVLIVCGYALASMGGVMAWRVQYHGSGTDTGVETGHLLMLTLMMPAVAVLAQRLTQMRRRLQTQKRELKDALDRIQFLATRDSLTGLINRGHLTELLEREAQRHRRGRTRVSIALMDLDGFKSINDQHGHACGDEVLKAFARAASSTVRVCDALGRWGGEEFLLVMPDTGLEAARAGTERVRATIEALAVQQDRQCVSFTLSAGVAEVIGDESIEALVERADRALYEAKSSGRNRVVAAR